MRSADLVGRFVRDRDLAHRVLFAHRHPQPSPEFHTELRRDFWSEEAELVTLAFRGGAKSTNLEEDIILGACEHRFRNCVIIGASEGMAAERVAAIRHEFDTNELLVELYGDLKGGGGWSETELELSYGARIQARGRDQNIRGAKYLDWRPDWIMVDDFEDRDTVQSPEGRAKTLRWFLAEMLPIAEPRHKIRVLATPMDRDSVPMLLVRDAGWPCRRYPLVVRDERGREASAWPERYDMEWVERTRRQYLRLGQADIWDREFMVDAEAETAKIFHPAHFYPTPMVRSWQATYAMIDPARTIGPSSAMTGWAVWSWEGSRLIVWEAEAQFLLPDQIIEKVFEINNRWTPVWVGIEENGLEEWLRQPLRGAMAERGYLPVRGVRAPRGKLDFIRGLQPLFASGNLVLASDMPVLRDQFLGFPRGRIDAPNALAYAQQERPGRLIYDGFGPEHIGGALFVDPAKPLYVAWNASRILVTAIAVQLRSSSLWLFADFVEEGEVVDGVQKILSQLRLQGVDLVHLASPVHFDRWQNVGLVQALAAELCEVRHAGELARGRHYLRDLLDRSEHGLPCLRVADQARWCLRGFSGGYALGVDKRGVIEGEAKAGPYRLLFEGLESFAGLLAHGGIDEDDRALNWATDKAGRRYLSIVPQRV